MCSYSLCLFVSCFAPSFAIANLIAPLVIVMFLLPSGFLVNIADLPVYWRWLKYVSFFRYGFEALMINEFSGLELTTNPSKFAPHRPGKPVCDCPPDSAPAIVVPGGLEALTVGAGNCMRERDSDGVVQGQPDKRLLALVWRAVMGPSPVSSDNVGVKGFLTAGEGCASFGASPTARLHACTLSCALHSNTKSIASKQVILPLCVGSVMIAHCAVSRF